MHNLGDDRELDRMSREAAGKYTVPGMPDWQKMETELDKALPVEKKRRRLLFWWLLPVVLAGGVTYWNIGEGTGDREQGTRNVEQGTGNKEQGTRSVEQEILNKEQGTGNREQATKNIEQGTRNVEEGTGNRQQATGNKEQGQEQDITPDGPLKQVENTTSQPGEQVLPPAAKTTSGDHTIFEQPAEEKNDTAVAEDSQIVSVKKKAGVFRYGKGISVSAIAGVDKSTVRFSYGDNPGINVGLVAGYHFNEKLSVHTGAIYTQKNYKMAGKDFHAPKGSWASYYKLDEVEGYCRMWEVPVLVRYAFGQNGRRNYFASAGLSSYFMTSERYTYYYHHQGQPATRSATYGAGDSHVFSIAHISAGYESSLSRNIRLQIEPYAKIPLAGVGFGSIQLSSFGVNFGLQFRQPSKH